MQGQGMERVGDQTLYWYSLWMGVGGTGVRAVSWECDRFGFLQPTNPSDAEVVSLPVEVLDGSGAGIYVNASGLGEHSQLRISLMDRGFSQIPSYSGEDAAIVREDGFHVSVRWRDGSTRLPSQRCIRLRIRFSGARPENARLHAIYVVGEAQKRGVRSNERCSS